MVGLRSDSEQSTLLFNIGKKLAWARLEPMTTWYHNTSDKVRCAMMPLLAGHNKYYLLWLLSASRHLRLAMRHVTVVTQLSPPPSPTTTTTPDAEHIWCRQIVSNFFFFINVMSNYDCSAHSLWRGSVLENDIKDVRTRINEIIGWCSLYFLIFLAFIVV